MAVWLLITLEEFPDLSRFLTVCKNSGMSGSGKGTSKRSYGASESRGWTVYSCQLNPEARANSCGVLSPVNRRSPMVQVG